MFWKIKYRFMKTGFLKSRIYAFQFAFDYPLYWRMRIALQNCKSNDLGGQKDGC